MNFLRNSVMAALALVIWPVGQTRANTGPGGTILPNRPGTGLFLPRPAPPTIPAHPNSGLPQPSAAHLQIGVPPGLLCRQAIRAAEQQAAIPSQLMAAIGRVESGRRDANGVVHPWPWSINVEGTDHIYDTKADAIAAVRAFQAQGIKSIDVGCMQVNLMFHPGAFASLDQAFDPAANATYAARYLRELFAQTGSWPKATAAYHSATPELGTPYQQKVASVWREEQRQLSITPGASGNVWSNNAFTKNVWNAGVAGGGNGLTNNADAAKIIALPPGAVGRSLASYRSAPVNITRLPTQVALTPARPPS